MATREYRNIYFPKYFMDVRKFTNIYVPKYFCTSVNINPFGTIGLTTAIFFVLDSPVWVALLYMGQPP